MNTADEASHHTVSVSVPQCKRESLRLVIPLNYANLGKCVVPTCHSVHGTQLFYSLKSKRYVLRKNNLRAKTESRSSKCKPCNPELKDC